MSCGIYKLNFIGTNKVYIGQSINLENRLVQHCSRLRTGTSSIKLNNAFLAFGLPTLEFLEVCTESDLDRLEEVYIDTWNSVDNGFNTFKEAGHRVDLKGELHGNAKHTNEQIIKVFNMLIDTPTYTFEDISAHTEVSISTIKHIAQGDSHTWLQEQYPLRYEALLSLIGSRNSYRKSAKGRGIVYPTILSPDNVPYNVENLTGFARLHNLDTRALHRVLHRKAKTHKKWRLKE